MANTPIYGWETPDDTDYVYQGAAAARTTANAIDSTLSTQLSNTGYGSVSSYLDSSTTFAASTTETLCFSGAGFTPIAGRKYEVTWGVGNISKTTATGVIYARLRKTNTSGTLLDAAIWQVVAANNGFPFSKTVVLTSTQLGTTTFAPAFTIQASTNGVYVESTAGSAYGYGTISIKDIGPA
jgi:hypothetical protein